MRSQIKKEVHSGHQGINTCLQRARYEQKVKEWIQSGEACREFKQTHRKETLMSHEDPRQAWEKISYDLVSYHGKDYQSLLQVQLLGAWPPYWYQAHNCHQETESPPWYRIPRQLVSQALSLFPGSIGTSPRPGVLSTPPCHLITAKLNQLWKWPCACCGKPPSQGKTNSLPCLTSGMPWHKAWTAVQPIV